MAAAHGAAASEAYHTLISSIMEGLGREPPVARRTRSHDRAAAANADASNEATPSENSGSSTDASAAGTDSCSSDAALHARGALGAEAAHAQSAHDEGVQRSAPEAAAGPDILGDASQQEEGAWPVVPWNPSIDAPAAATAEHASQRRQHHAAAASAQPGAAKLAQAPVRDVRREQRSAARSESASAGAGWFDMKAQTITPEVKRDWRLLRLRSTFDPRRFYKGFDSTKIPKHFEMGTVVAGAGEFYSGRLTRKQRKQTFTEEILHDVQIKQERKRRFDAMQEEKQDLARKRKKMGPAHKHGAAASKHAKR